MSAVNRTILIAGMGTSTAVLTETVWALVLKVKGSRKDEIDFQD